MRSWLKKQNKELEETILSLKVDRLEFNKHKAILNNLYFHEAEHKLKAINKLYKNCVSKKATTLTKKEKFKIWYLTIFFQITNFLIKLLHNKKGLHEHKMEPILHVINELKKEHLKNMTPSSVYLKALGNIRDHILDDYPIKGFSEQEMRKKRAEEGGCFFSIFDVVRRKKNV